MGVRFLYTISKSSLLKMILTILILSSLCNAIQARCSNTTDSFSKEAIQRKQPLCGGMTVKNCQKKYPREVERCEICGIANAAGISHSVIGGRPVKPPYLYPWMVAIQQGPKKVCGAAIISDNYLITAAHCFIKNQQSNYMPHELSIGFLTSTYNVENGPSIERLIPHPGFHPSHFKNDIALIKLSRKITCNMYRNPICLPPAEINPARGTVFTITGWGIIQTPPPRYPNELQVGAVKLESMSSCEREYPYRVQDMAYCLIGVNNQRPCFGDSGGSMFRIRSKNFISLGVTSFGSINCSEGRPFVYTSIPKHMSWIRQVTGLSESG